jgi:alpha-mannosidase
VHDDRRVVEGRVRRSSTVSWPALYGATRRLTLGAWHVEGEPAPVAQALAP